MIIIIEGLKKGKEGFSVRERFGLEGMGRKRKALILLGQHMQDPHHKKEHHVLFPHVNSFNFFQFKHLAVLFCMWASTIVLPPCYAWLCTQSGDALSSVHCSKCFVYFYHLQLEFQTFDSFNELFKRRIVESRTRCCKIVKEA